MSHLRVKSISVKGIAKKTGLSVRQIQRLAAKSGEDSMPGVKRNADGYHNTYELTPELSDWIKKQQKRSKGRQKQIIEKHDGGTENFGTAINRIVVLDGKLKRAGNYDNMTTEQLFELHADLLPAVQVWAEVVARLDGGNSLPADLGAEFREDIATLSQREAEKRF